MLWDQFVKHTEDVYIIYDGQCRYRFINERGSQYLAKPIDEIVGRSNAEVLSEEAAKSINPYIEETIRTREPQFFEHSFKIGQKVRHFRTSMVPQREPRTGEWHVYTVCKDITSLKEAKNALDETQNRYDLALNAATDGLWDWNIETGHVFFSDKWCEMLGYHPSEIRQHYESWARIAHPEDLPKAKVELEKLFAREIPVYQMEHRCLMKDGSWKWVLARGQVVKWSDDGKPLRAVGTHKDISESKLQEQELRKTKTVLEEAQRIAKLGSWEYDLTSDKITWSRENFSIFGLDPDKDKEPTYESFIQMIHPDDREHWLQLKSQVKQTGAPYEVEFRVVLPDGGVKHVWGHGRCKKNEAGKVLYMHGVCQDMTDRKQQEEALTRSESMLKEAQSIAKIGSWDYDVLRQKVSWTDEAFRIFGMPPGSEPPTYDFHKYHQVHPEDRAHWASVVERAMLTGESYQVEFRNIRPDGTSRNVLGMGRCTKDDTGRVVYMHGTVQDITEIKELEERRKLVLDCSKHGYFDWEVPSGDVYYDENWFNLFGYEDQELPYHLDTWKSTVDPNVRDSVLGDVGKHFEGELEFFNVTFPAYKKDGSRIWIHARGKCVSYDQDGKPLRVCGTAYDCSAKMIAEEKIKEALKEAEAASIAKSAFLATMSHEIRTPMNAVIGMASLLQDSDLTDEQNDFVDTIRSSGDSLLNIINAILDYSKIESGKMELECSNFDLRQSIEEVVDLLAVNAFAKDLKLTCNLDPEVPAIVRGDSTRFRQIIVNLVGNAIKFTKLGEVLVSGRMISSSGDRVRLEFKVQDTGIGIPDDRKERLFKPFSQVDGSTSRKYGGTGLGLVISERLCSMMGGHMIVCSNPGEGAIFTFTVEFESVPTHKKDYLCSHYINLESKKVVLACDHYNTRQGVLDYLTHWGMPTICVDTEEEALRSLKECKDACLLLWDDELGDYPQEAIDAINKSREPDNQIAHLTLYPFGSRPPKNIYGVSKPVRASHLFDQLMNVYSDMPTPRRLTRAPLIDNQLSESYPLRILLAEDNMVNQKVAKNILNRMGYEVDIVSNGLEAVQSAQRGGYDLVLMDIQMPEMDGLDATRRIHENLEEEESSDRPWIVALTAGAMDTDRRKTEEAGMDDFISKPIKIDELQSILKRCSKEKGLTSELTAN